MQSPTQIETATECKRKLALKYWGKKFDIFPPPRDPDKPDSRPLGIEMHKVAEDYLNIGSQPDRLTQAGEMFLNGLQFLPGPRSGCVEGEFSFNFQGLEFGGLIDYWGPLHNFGCYHDDGKAGGVYAKRVIVDHKTSKNPEKYGIWGKHGIPEHERPSKRDASKMVKVDAVKGFLQNPQAIVYALYDLIRYREDVVNLRWIYYKSTRPYQAVCSDATLTKMEVLEAFGSLILPVSKEIEALKRDEPHPLSLDPNPDACDNYGGCEWKTVCNLSPLEQLRTPRKDLIMEQSLVERAKADILRKKGIAPAPATAGATGTAADIANPPEAKTAPAPMKPPGPPPPRPPGPPAAPQASLVPKGAAAALAASMGIVASAVESVGPPAPKRAPANVPVPVAVDMKALAILADEIGDALKRFAARIK